MRYDFHRPARLPSEAILLPATDERATRINITTLTSALRYPWPDTSNVEQRPLWCDRPEQKKERGISLGQAALRSLLKT